jgi:hypothetical protein
MSLDFTVYPDSYPVFNKPRQFLIRNHAAHIEQAPLRNRKITKTPGIRRLCEIQRTAGEEFISPPNLPELSQSKPSSSMGNYQVSYYPTSPLNPELEQRCNILEVFRLLKPVKVHRLKLGKVKKNVRKNQMFKFDAEFRKMNKLMNLIEKAYNCSECGKNPCQCEMVAASGCVNEDLGKEESLSKVVHTSLNDTKRDRYTSIDNFVTPKINLNKTKMDFMGKKTKRRARHVSLDTSALRRDLLITPCTLATKSFR